MRRTFLGLLAVALAVPLLGMAPAGAATTPPPDHQVAAYFLINQPAGGPYLVPAARTLSTDTAIPAATVQQLLAGPTTAEQAAGISTAVPAGTTLQWLHLNDGIATVSLSAQYASGGGSSSVFSRLAQLVYTLTRFPTIDGVRVAIDGTVVSTFSSEGLVLANPLTRSYFAGQGLTAPIFVDQPTWTGLFGHRLVGTTSVPGGAFTVSVRTTAGTVLATQAVTAVNGVFDVNVPYTLAADTPGTVTVYTGTASAPANQSSYPVTLQAGTGTPWLRTLSNACPTPPAMPFTDVPPADPHAVAIACAFHWGIVQGTSATTFAPVRMVTREQLAAMVARMIGVTGGTLPANPPARFPDVSGSVFRLQILQLAQLGVLNGYPNGDFQPLRVVTRSQVAAVLQRAYQVRTQAQLGSPGNFFTDDANDPNEAAINALAAVGILGGYGNGTVAPSALLTREQLTTMLSRTVDLLVAGGYATAH